MRKTWIWTITVLSLGLVACAPRAPEAPASTPWPGTVDEAVDRLLGELPADDVDWMRRNPKDGVISQLYMGYGTGVRNQFGLWGGRRPAQFLRNG